MVLVVHSYDTVSRGISQVRTMEVRSSNRGQKRCRTNTNASKKHKLGKKAVTGVFASDWLASGFACLPPNDMIGIRRCMWHIEELHPRLTLQRHIGQHALEHRVAATWPWNSGGSKVGAKHALSWHESCITPSPIAMTTPSRCRGGSSLRRAGAAARPAAGRMFGCRGARRVASLRLVIKSG